MTVIYDGYGCIEFQSPRRRRFYVEVPDGVDIYALTQHVQDFFDSYKAHSASRFAKPGREQRIVDYLVRKFPNG